MTTTLNSFVSESQLGLTEDALITCGSSEKKFIGKMTATNTSAANVEVTFWRIATATTGTTGSGGNWAVVKTIPAGATVEIYELEGQVIDNSMKLSGLASVASVVNIGVSGTTES